MIRLYNGEYQEVDIPLNANDQQILDGLENRKRYIGRQVGDYEIETVEYDWGERKQVNVAKCIRCGKKKEIPNLRDFERGKGVGRTCSCRYKKEASIPKRENYRTYIGQTIGSFRLVDYQVGKGFRTECIECGKQKWVSGNRVLAGKEMCNHKVVHNYSDPSYIGKRVGNLTVLRQEGKLFHFRCDCGAEIIQRPTDVFRIESKKTCGRDECPYHQATLRTGTIRRQKGIAFEKECAAMMEEQGYSTQMTPDSGDYGVDFFAIVNGERVAFQCKRLKIASLVRSVQEVYAGGRYYDCCRFVVVSPSGFSYSAELMAAKLGVQLELNLQNFRLKELEGNIINTKKRQTFAGREEVWEVDGITKPANQWCGEYGLSKSTVRSRIQRGMDLKAALTAPKYSSNGIQINGISKTKQEWCDLYGISPQLYDYRVKYSGLSPIKALTKEKRSK